LRRTGVGYLIHHLSATLWASLYEGISSAPARKKSTRRIVAEAAAVTAVAFVVDYGLTPRRLRPGFEKQLSPLSMLAVYASFAAGLASATALRRVLQT
jgi:hypothetical protein